MIEECEGYQKLLRAVECDEVEQSDSDAYRRKLRWVVDRVKHYAEQTGCSAEDLLNGWERRRDYWYMNYYNEANQPKLDGQVFVFSTREDLQKSVGTRGFRCPQCSGVSRDPYTCDTGIMITVGQKSSRKQAKQSKKVVLTKICDWKSYGLFGTLGKGAKIFVLETMSVQTVFFPVAWEQQSIAHTCKSITEGGSHGS